jgi:hypothetical protein
MVLFLALSANATPVYAETAGKCDTNRLGRIVMFDADPQKSVLELAGILDEPFDPIRVGVDSGDVIAEKLSEIQCRADIVDLLGIMGEMAASSSAALMDWALAKRVIAPIRPDPVDNGLFVDLLAIDILERMRVAGAVARFGPAAVREIAIALKSGDGERRKLAVAILSENSLPVARILLKSEDCDDRMLGISILADMWPVIPKDHLKELKNATVCDARLTVR